MRISLLLEVIHAQTLLELLKSTDEKLTFDLKLAEVDEKKLNGKNGDLIGNTLYFPPLCPDGFEELFPDDMTEFEHGNCMKILEPLSFSDANIKVKSIIKRNDFLNCC
jgi:hypothetical protein